MKVCLLTICLLGVSSVNGLALKTSSETESGLQATVNQLQKTVSELSQGFAALQKQNAELKSQLTESGEWAHSDDGSRIPTTMNLKDGSTKPRSLADRLHYLERKTNGDSNWLTEVRLSNKPEPEHVCSNVTDFDTQDDHHICFDSWEKNHPPGSPPCVVYDLGIRAQPSFGYLFATKMGCKVRAYDPSDVSKRWWAGKELNADMSHKLRQMGEDSYKFHSMAAAGKDGPLELFEYNWGQVSIVKAEKDLTLSPDQVEKSTRQRRFNVEAKTLPTMMMDNGDTHIDVLKIDIEGSEYALMQDVFDRMGCPPASQITMEYHNFDFDERYGVSSQLNTIHNLLSACGFKTFATRDHWRAPASDAKYDSFYLPPARIALISYCKEC